ncbi:SDR family NAD(P)-dependent oxidoreductase [Paenibacillus hodogayensis]|uniref:SDR family NAD(P)-dependent oxidoreductase n=1 Tax=Paenibacillus hodogayensis TaxID=279208 RepID=A0ABV5W0G0_9BACL
MKTILVTGGSDGIGKGVAMHLLRSGNQVIVVGSSATKGRSFLNEAKQIGAGERATFLQANLSLVSENKRVIEEVQTRFASLDSVIFCATSHTTREQLTETEEGFEFNFALSYLSRFVLSFGLKEMLEKAAKPVIVNVCAPGMNGTVNLEDIQNKRNYNGAKIKYHGSRLNDLLGVAFSDLNYGKIKYVLFNPWAVQTKGYLDSIKNPINKALARVAFKLIGKPVEKAVLPIIDHIEAPPAQKLSAYIQRKEVSLSKNTFNLDNAHQLYQKTLHLMKGEK